MGKVCYRQGRSLFSKTMMVIYEQEQVGHAIFLWNRASQSFNSSACNACNACNAWNYMMLIDSNSLHYIANSIMKAEEDCINIEDDEPGMEIEVPKLPLPTGNTAFDVQFQLSAESLREEPDAYAQLFRRMSKFFQYNRVIQPGKEHFRPRKEANYQHSEVVATQLILFGIDFKKYKELHNEFSTPVIQKINDSNCKLVFKSYEQAWNAIIKNAKQPQTLVMKRQCENTPVPQCWFQMKPYIHLEKTVDMQVRFATTEDLAIEPEKEELIYTYKDSKDIFNNQENRLKDEERLTSELKREKLDIRKQRNSELLYTNYQNQNRAEWMTGKDKNPGAVRQESRQRSRDKASKKKSVNEEDDAVSSYSYASNTKKEMREINKKLNNCSISDQPQVPQEELDLSYDISGTPVPTNTINLLETNSSKDYNWKGTSSVTIGGRFKYQEYMRQTEQEQQRRKNLVQVVIID